MTHSEPQPREKQAPTIVQIVVKNTSELDFSLPLLCALKRQQPAARVVVLFTQLSRLQTMRRGQYFSNCFAAYGIEQLDFADFVFGRSKFLSSALRAIFYQNYSDRISVSQFVRGLRSRGFDFALISLFFRILRERSVAAIESFVLRLCSVETILPGLNPNVILLGNRSLTLFFGRESFYSYFYSQKRPVVLLPHSVHEVQKSASFIPFDDRGEKLAAFNEFWYCLRFEESWQNCPSQRDQFKLVGYPGLDDWWLSETLKNTRQRGAGEPLRCLFVMRKFFAKGVKKKAGEDPYALEYDETLAYLKKLNEAILATGHEIEVVAKPHPSTNFNMLGQLFADSGITRWRASDECFYDLLGKIDVSVGLFSTSLLLPIAARIPSLILHSSLQQYIHDGWSVMHDLYRPFSGYVEDLNELPMRFSRLIAELESDKQTEQLNRDLAHLREYFPDGAIQNSLQRIEVLCHSPSRS